MAHKEAREEAASVGFSVRETILPSHSCSLPAYDSAPSAPSIRLPPSGLDPDNLPPRCSGGPVILTSHPSGIRVGRRSRPYSQMVADLVRPENVSDEISEMGTLLELLERLRPAFHRDAACKETPEVTFFPEKGEDSRPAKAVCAGCLVLVDCRQWALDQGPKLAGIWGGMSPRERRQVLGAQRAA